MNYIDIFIYSINDIAISGQINYVTCLNSNFYLIKISKTPPKKCNSNLNITIYPSIYLFPINFLLKVIEKQ